VKHSSRAPTLDPAEIGSSVRAIVEAFLRGVHGGIDPEFSARMEKLAATLALWGAKMNLTAHPEDPEEIAFHVIDSVMPVVLGADPTSMVADALFGSGEVLDLGSGAGFPGLVLAAASSANFTLVESRRKRASFLQFAVAEMGLTNVTIEARRAEDLGAKGYDLVTARAFGDAGDFFNLAKSSLKPGRFALLYANPTQQFGLDVDRVPYSIQRRAVRVDRILALWKQPAINRV
jgi:16S rRNA (guanine(527)-N(7))-methyltransferase RsmG